MLFAIFLESFIRLFAFFQVSRRFVALVKWVRFQFFKLMQTSCVLCYFLIFRKLFMPFLAFVLRLAFFLTGLLGIWLKYFNQIVCKFCPLRLLSYSRNLYVFCFLSSSQRVFDNLFSETNYNSAVNIATAMINFKWEVSKRLLAIWC